MNKKIGKKINRKIKVIDHNDIKVNNLSKEKQHIYRFNIKNL